MFEDNGIDIDLYLVHKSADPFQDEKFLTAYQQWLKDAQQAVCGSSKHNPEQQFSTWTYLFKENILDLMAHSEYPRNHSHYLEERILPANFSEEDCNKI